VYPLRRVTFNDEIFFPRWGRRVNCTVGEERAASWISDKVQHKTEEELICKKRDGRGNGDST
jgi:hypothetical protein